jgi:nicotinate-nucleotide pyrophosphorylase (carboxylating)
VRLVSGRCYLEVSGGVTLKNIHRYLIPGVDAISVGALTHSAGNVDISLEVEY